MKRYLIDANVPLYALGEDHRWRHPSVAVMTAAIEGRIQLHASTEAMQELVFHRMRMASRTTAIAETRRVSALTRLHPFDDAVWSRALDLIETTPLRGRDAVHAATALEHGLTHIVTTDSGFISVPGLTPVAPDQVDLG